MDKFFQAVALSLLAVILILVLQKQGKESAVLLSLLVCCTVGAAAFAFLEPVLELMERLQRIGSLDDPILHSLIKIVGIAITGEVASLICTDAGNASLGKVLSFMGTCVILWLSIPVLTTLLELVEGILEKL